MIQSVYNDDYRKHTSKFKNDEIDLLLIDPPYGINIGKMGYTSSSNGVNYSDIDISWDRYPPTEYELKELIRISKRQVIFGANHFSQSLPASRCWIVWDKRVDIPSNDYADCELIWTSLDAPSRIIRYKWSGIITSKESDKRYHPTQKPLSLMIQLVEMFSKPNELVMDCFAGSGTTLMACKIKGRQYIGYETCKEYYEIIKERLSQQELMWDDA